ncbi:alpha/beta hydrolase [Catellatospora sp. KI3]|uniref:alpha/beta fold hydrolase n=1 Tax=Catellatospora sp. KI3 TaxID=3041620 RepID=UPI0024822B6C|nr:alpha/beta hydrolase [Catellatospora sp. KI3]MDI1460927.1 alpha/beta hydrolase [Catellatospora sp. KI3]
MTIETGTLLGRIPYARVGRDDQPILVLAGGQAFMQRPTPQRIARDAGRVAAVLPPDRGFILLGYDPAPGESHSLATIVADVAAIIGELGAPVQLVGVSYGGIVALRVAADHPDLVSELVLLASAHRFSPEGSQLVRRQLDLAADGDFAALGADFVGMFRRPWLNWLLRLRLRTRRGRAAEGMNDPQVIVRGLRAVLDSPVDEASLSLVSARTLIVSGTHDQVFGREPERTAALLPHASLVQFPGETHMVPVERRRAVAMHTRALLTSRSR